MSEPINSIISAWVPERDPHTLATLGKAAEECNELAGRLQRCIIQGLDEKDPESGRTNREEASREISDVLACISQLGSRLGIVANSIRIEDKYRGFQRWHDLIDEALAKPPRPPSR